MHIEKWKIWIKRKKMGGGGGVDITITLIHGYTIYIII